MAWFTAAGGTVCVAAYDAVGAASLADSYVNEANPGTYDLVASVAPTWAYGTGWTANGSAVIYAPISISSLHSYIVRATYTAYHASGDFIGVYTGGGGVETEIRREDSGGRIYYSIGNVPSARPGAPGAFTGDEVFAVTGSGYYRNGSKIGSLSATFSAGTATQIAILGRRRQDSSTYDQKLNGATVQAVAIYSGTLTDADVVAITAAMQNLPNLPSAGLLQMMQQHAVLGWI